MPRIGRLLGLVAAVGGIAAACGITGSGHALVLPPTPTVSVPTPLPVPVPPPPAAPPPLPTPQLPPLPAPAPPPVSLPVSEPTPAVSAPVAAPRLTQPANAVPPLTARPTAPSTAAAAETPPSSTAAPAQPSASTAWSSGATPERRQSAAAPQRRLEAKTQRTNNRVSVRLEFTLPEAKRVFLIVRGPSPSCEIVGVIPFRGRKGENAASFSGRVRGRALEPGVYSITISPKRRLPANAPTEYVRVSSPRRTVPLPEGARKPRCTAAQALAAAAAYRFLANEQDAALAAPTRPAVPAAPLRPPLGPPTPSLDPGDRAGGILDGIPRPAEIGTAPESLGEVIATFLVLVVAGLLLLSMLGLVARFMRGSWNP
jgi:hypothetical protein